MGQKIICGLAQTVRVGLFLITSGRAGLQKCWPVPSLVHGIMIGVCFVAILMTSLSDTTSRYCGFFDSTQEYKSLEPLIEFLAFLVQKLGQKNSKHFRNFLGDLGDFPN